jgi:hypothetical protein
MKRWTIGLILSAAAIVVAGCETKAPPVPVVAPPTVQPAEPHGAHGAGPHGGTLADWGGGKYHVEFTVDHDKKQTVIYVLGNDEKTATPIKAGKIMVSIIDPASEIEAIAQPQDGETDGMSSRFVGTHDNLGKVQEYAGTISGEIDGTPYTGDFKELPAVEAPK